MTRSGNDPRRSAGDRSLGSRPRKSGSLAHSSLWDDDEALDGPREPHRPAGRPVDQLTRPFSPGQSPYAQRQPPQSPRQPPIKARREPAQVPRQPPVQARREPQQVPRQPPAQVPRRPTEPPRQRPMDAQRPSPTDTHRRAAAQTRRRRTAVGRFVHRHGWRAYSIPLLVALTVSVIVQGGRPFTAAAPAAVDAQALAPAVGGTSAAPTTGLTASTVPGTPVAGPAAGAGADEASGRAANPAAGGAATAAASTTVPSAAAPPGAAVAGGSPSPSAAPGPNGNWATLPSAALPSGPTFVAKGLGTWHVVQGTSPVLGSGSRKYTFTIEVEDGMQSAPADQDFARAVDAALADPRSWIGSGRFALQRVDTGIPSFRISLTSRMTVRQDTLCGWQIPYEASCYARDVKRVAINEARWLRGAVSFHGDLASYRVYAVNHEVGHALGYFHLPCATNGGPAPVMMQQSWSTADDDLAQLDPQLIPMDGKVCRANPYPYPSGAGSPNAVGG